MAIRNTFNDGMVQDAIDSLSPNSSYSLAKNAIHASRNEKAFGLVNEISTREVAEFSGDIVGNSFIEEWNNSLIFVNNNGKSELWLFDHNNETKTFVASDTEFGCDWGFSNCEYIYAEFKHMNACEDLYAYFSSDCVYHVVNLTEMLNPVRKQAVKDCEDCIYFDLFHCICGPKLSATPVENTGSSFEGGAVAFAVQLEDEDGNQTNWFNMSHTTYVETENNIPGEPAIESVRLTLSSLDTRYSRVNIAVIKTVSGVTTAEKLLPISYSGNGLTFDYYGQKGEPINIAEIVTKHKAYLKGQDLIQKDGRLFYYNLKNERNLNYQKYANDIEIGLFEYEVTMEQNLKYSYPSLLRGEAYAPAIIWNYCDGTHSHAFALTNMSEDSTAVATALVGAATDPGRNPAGRPTVTNFNTTDQFVRERNPPEPTPESNVMRDEISNDVDNVDSNESDLIGAAGCHDTLYGCGEAGDAFTADLPQYSNILQNQAELLSEMTEGDSDPQDVELNKTASIKEAAQELIGRGVVEKEFIRRKRPTFTYQDRNPIATGDSDNQNTVSPPGQGTSLRGDNWVDGDGNNLTEEAPRVTWQGSPSVYESTLEYPDYKDCNGERIYPEGKIKFPRIPSASARPHFVSYTDGVISQYQPENYEYGNCYVRLMGFSFSNIHIPTEDELPKPLCPDNPFSIVYVKRTDQNKSIFAKGWFSGTFEGEVYGKLYAFPRHGVNSFEHVDRHIHTGADNTSRMGIQTPNSTKYTFHSPDTDADKSFLPITHAQSELYMTGSGWRYGLYAEGRNTIQDQWSGTRKDQRGARVANNLNHYSGTGQQKTSVRGITYAPGNSVVTNPSNVELPLMNKFRESSVYLETDTRLAGDDLDQSFVGDVLDHFCPTSANAPYGALIRELPDQYGGIDSLTYIPLGLEATSVHANMFAPGTKARINGICGDVFIIPYSKRRTSYVSNKVGNDYIIPAKPGSRQRTRTVCDSPDDSAFELMGINHYPTRLPQSGDIYDPKNYAGLHSVPGITETTETETETETGEECLCETCNATAPFTLLGSSDPGPLSFDFTFSAPNGTVTIRETFSGQTDTSTTGQVIINIPSDQNNYDLNVTIENGDCTYTGQFYTTPAEVSVGFIVNESLDLDCDCIGQGGNTGGGGGSTTTVISPALSRDCADAAAQGISESDFYYPRVLKSLVHCVVESSVNAPMMQTGVGSQVETGKVFYPKLKDLYLDSAAPVEHPWEESFLNRFYCAVEQPSLKQLAKKALIRTFLNLIVPVLGLLRFDSLEAIVDTTGAMVTLPLLSAFWVYANNTLFTDRKLNELLGIGDCRTDDEGGDLDECIENWEDAWARYNWDYSKQTEEQVFYSPPPNYNTCVCDDCDKGTLYGRDRELNNEIYHSAKQNLDSEIDAYRNVKIHTYNELPSHSGHLKKLFIQGQGLFAHTTDGIWALKFSEGTFPGDIGSQLTGAGELYADPIMYFEGSQEGFLGTHHPNSSINVGGWGYFFIDDVARKVYRFNGQPEEISAYGMDKFFTNHLPFCEAGDCFDEKLQDTYFSMGWDPEYDRLLITKKDKTDANSWTISYTPLGSGADGRGKWLSLHDYFPNNYIWDRNSMYSYLDGKIWKHNDSDSYQIFYGKPRPFILEFSVKNPENFRAFDFANGAILTEASRYDAETFTFDKGLDISFNQVALWNNSQSTGLRPVNLISDDIDERNHALISIQENPSEMRLKKYRGLWNFNEVYDLVSNACKSPILPTVRNSVCQVVPTINNAIVDCSPQNRQDHRGSVFSGRYLNFRWVFDVCNDIELKVIMQEVEEDTNSSDKRI